MSATTSPGGNHEICWREGFKAKSHVDVYDVYCIHPSSLFLIGQTKPKQYFRAKKASTLFFGWKNSLTYFSHRSLGITCFFKFLTTSIMLWYISLFHRRRLLSMTEVIEMGFLTIKGCRYKNNNNSIKNNDNNLQNDNNFECQRSSYF